VPASTTAAIASTPGGGGTGDLLTPTGAAPALATPSSSVTKTPAPRPDIRPDARSRAHSPGAATPPPTPKPVPLPAPAPAPTTVSLEQLPALLAAFYRQHNPGREKDCGAILRSYKGRELELIRKLEKQYAVPFLQPNK